MYRCCVRPDMFRWMWRCARICACMCIYCAHIFICVLMYRVYVRLDMLNACTMYASVYTCMYVHVLRLYFFPYMSIRVYICMSISAAYFIFVSALRFFFYFSFLVFFFFLTFSPHLPSSPSLCRGISSTMVVKFRHFKINYQVTSNHTRGPGTRSEQFPWPFVRPSGYDMLLIEKSTQSEFERRNILTTFEGGFRKGRSIYGIARHHKAGI